MQLQYFLCWLIAVPPNLKAQLLLSFFVISYAGDVVPTRTFVLTCLGTTLADKNCIVFEDGNLNFKTKGEEPFANPTLARIVHNIVKYFNIVLKALIMKTISTYSFI